MNPLLPFETRSGPGPGLSPQAAPPVEEIAMLLCARDGQVQSFTETILFVEDEDFVREVAGEILRSAGYRVLCARSTEEALITYKECRGRVDLLLTDVVLPGESGPTLARKLRIENPVIKTLFITGYIDRMRKMVENALEEWLSKPFSAQALLQRVRHVLDEPGRSKGNVFRHAAGSG